MIVTSRFVTGLKDYLAGQFNAHLQAVGAELEIQLPELQDVMVGWRDPLRLRRYPSVLVVPGIVQPTKEKSLILPVDLVFAVQGRDPEEVTETETAYLDAFLSLYDEDRSFVGLCFEAALGEAALWAPAEGAAHTGVVHVQIDFELDMLC